MANANEDRIKQAAAAIKAGRKTEARDILLAVVEEDERNEKAWLYLSGLVETLEEQQICLENVLAINPDNGKAQRGLQQIQQRLGDPQPSDVPASDPESPSPFSAAPPDVPAPPPSRAFGSGPIGSEFETVPGDSFAGSGFDTPAAPPPATSGGFDWMSSGFDMPATPPAEPPERDPLAPATSVEWARDDGPTAYGSGRQIDLPSAQEYDDWVQGLNLNNPIPTPPPPAAPAAPPANSGPSPFIMDDDAPFGDTSFMVEAGPFGAPESAEPSEPDGTGVFGDTAWDSEPAAAFETPARSVPDASRGGSGFSSLEDSLRSSIAFDDDYAEGDDSGSRLAGLEAARSAGPRALAGAGAPAGRKSAAAAPETAAGAAPRPAGASAPAARTEDYFRYIPEDITGESGSSGRTLALLGAILILIALNAASFAYMLL